MRVSIKNKKAFNKTQKRTNKKNKQGSHNPKKKRKTHLKKQHEWLGWLNVRYSEREVKIEMEGTSYITADAFVECSQGEYRGFVYEFWGDYWHGNPTKHDPNKYNKVCKKTMRELYEKTMEKRERIIAAGFFLVEIWESDWDLIRNGKKWESTIENHTLTYKARK